ncbi:MAG: beta-CASP ribonuclease aCPSF1 [archaeon]|nr:beta-CASP ribonuclease aCPSF1 [archaeon]
MSNTAFLDNFEEKILESLPVFLDISKIEFEGPKIVVYSRNKKILSDSYNIVKKILKKQQKTIEIRSDPSIRLKKDNVKAKIHDLISPKKITEIYFDDFKGEVNIYLREKKFEQNKYEIIKEQIKNGTFWIPKIHKISPIKSKSILSIRNLEDINYFYIKEILNKIGRRIYRPSLFKKMTLKVTALGGFQEIGRSAILLRTSESTILLDCGINLGDKSNEFPYLNIEEFRIENLDAVILSHAHLDHSGMIPYLFKIGYEGPVYCTQPTRTLLILLQRDYLVSLKKENQNAPYGIDDMKEEILHTIPISYGKLTKIAPNIELTLYNSGHILGSSLIYLNFGDEYNLLYSGDYDFQTSKYLKPAFFPSNKYNVLITESTFGGMQDNFPPIKESRRKLIDIINLTIKSDGRILIPVAQYGNLQKIILLLEELISIRKIPNISIYINELIAESIAIHVSHQNYLKEELYEKIYDPNKNPFINRNFKIINRRSKKIKEITEIEPCIIISPIDLRQSDYFIDFFENFFENKNNIITFFHYNEKGTLSRKIQNGIKEIRLENYENQSKNIKIKAKSCTFHGFSGHSSHSQIITNIQKFKYKPDLILVNHGESIKCVELASSLTKNLNIETKILKNSETIVLK